MSAQRTWAVGVGTVLAALAVGVLFGPWGAAQPKAEPAATGRYQAVLLDPGSRRFLVVDTATGRCWSSRDQDLNEWRDLGAPPRPAK